MPALEVVMPKTDQKTKELLAKSLTEAFVSATNFEAEIFGIHFCEYEKDSVAIGGKIWDGKNGKPFLHLVLHCPRIRRSTKQKVVEALTDTFAETIGNQQWRPVVHICESPYDNVGVDGKLLSDLHEECAKRKFYYELPND